MEEDAQLFHENAGGGEKSPTSLTERSFGFYEDDAVGYLEKNETGKMSMKRVVLRPSVRFSGEGPNQEELSKLHEKAHRGCFIASSVNTEVRIEPPSA